MEMNQLPPKYDEWRRRGLRKSILLYIAWCTWCAFCLTNAVDAQSPASLRAASYSSVRPMKAVTMKKARANINSQANTSKPSANSFPTSSLPNAAPTWATSTPRVGKQKAQQAPCKPKVKKTTTTNAAAFRNELSRRLQTTASNFVNARVAFAPPNEDWMDPEQYSSVGAAFLVGVVTRFTITNGNNADNVCVPTALFEIRWINTSFQTKKHVHRVDESVIARGVRHHRELNIDLCPTEVEAIEVLTF
ncbi:unnamed protein product [Phytophthora fragariaefolia]|uniref:Unnamed protein product n=1 Tax=Phytophthora fragariaefolia TaxID=1490495 RepID=A0A9W6XZC3_9STRA|nr:unnamed protein product [Phytophthora fragariaefolia]